MRRRATKSSRTGARHPLRASRIPRRTTSCRSWSRRARRAGTGAGRLEPLRERSVAGEGHDEVVSQRLLLERFGEDFRLGTLPPALRASDRPIAIACLRLVTFLPERPLFKVPCLRSCIARFTFCCAFLPYLVAM